MLVICLFAWGISTKGHYFLQVGLKGEATKLYSPSSISSVDWMKKSPGEQKQLPLTWYKV